MADFLKLATVLKLAVEESAGGAQDILPDTPEPELAWGESGRD
eukprot:CAMPEP_0179842234 /NCGR_PEP_ID=MMETSP0982-20121206/3012_1 /TAXON_ID=483367 /ORGANISM="non described non described, Strain CCMP 2436" /LENGTH=42 /DNA_ID= /DNA_START= /DNA_END= /DNA_ORIENTATION=